jgi:DNA-binding CsgD family transcriptional regulator
VRARSRRAATGWASLTEAERSVAVLVAEGLSNPVIATRLFVSRHTVESHLKHAYAKLGISSRVELAGLALLEDSKNP